MTWGTAAGHAHKLCPKKSDFLSPNIKANQSQELLSSPLGHALAAFGQHLLILDVIKNDLCIIEVRQAFGVFVEYMSMDISSAQPLKESICKLINEKRFNNEDLIIVLAGSFGVKQGASYIEISTAGIFKEKRV